MGRKFYPRAGVPRAHLHRRRTRTPHRPLPADADVLDPRPSLFV